MNRYQLRIDTHGDDVDDRDDDNGRRQTLSLLSLGSYMTVILLVWDQVICP